MLSDDLFNIAAGLKAVAAGDRDRADLAGLVELAAGLLIACANDAREMEREIVPLRSQLAPNRLPPGVASLDDHRLRRAMAALPR